MSEIMSDLKQRADDAYCDYIAKMRTPLCLGVEAKMKAGQFDESNLKAHTEAAVLLGKHLAYADVAAALGRKEQRNG